MGGGQVLCDRRRREHDKMDGTVAPLRAMLDAMHEVFPAGNAHLVVDEAHSTGLYGSGGRGMVVLIGLEDRVHAQLHTFGKALAASTGAFIPYNFLGVLNTDTSFCVALYPLKMLINLNTPPKLTSAGNGQQVRDAAVFDSFECYY
jgi:hypothetical protein